MIPKSFQRADRVAAVVHQCLATAMLTHRERASFVGVTITAVKLSSDLANAKVFVVFGEKVEKIATLKNLNLVEGKFLRRILAKELNLRIVPQLLFLYDESIERGLKISHLIDAALTEDEKRH